MVFVLIATMGLIPVDQVVTSRGIVVSQSPTIHVQPLETAIVRSIDVHEGQPVKAGEVLARLDPTFATADAGTLTTQVSSLDAEVWRLKAEAEGKPLADPGLDPDKLLQAAIYEHRQAAFQLKGENYKHRIYELSALISRAQSDAAGYRNRLDVAQNVETMRRQLEQKEVGSKLNTLLAVDNRAEMARNLANAEQTAEGVKRDLAAMMSERDGYIQGWRAEVSEKLSDAGRKLNDAREQLNKAKLCRAMVELRSERDAIVQSLAKVSVGSVLQSGQAFITLVPTDAPLEVETNITGRTPGSSMSAIP
jgi:hemolysin D